MIQKTLGFIIVIFTTLLLFSCGGGGGSGSGGGGDCGSFEHEIDKYRCMIGDAQSKKSLGSCNNIPADFCWTGPGQGSSLLGNVPIMGNVRNNCYATTAHVAADPTMCDKIPDDDLACMANDFRFRWKDACYSDLADDVKDRSLCNKIKNARIRNSCLKQKF